MNAIKTLLEKQMNSLKHVVCLVIKPTTNSQTVTHYVINTTDLVKVRLHLTSNHTIQRTQGKQ